MEFLSRSQIQSLLGVPNTRNINRILQNMSTYLNAKRLNQNVYYLNKKGREYIGTDKRPPALKQLEHKLMRNDLYLYYNVPSSWQTEHEIEWYEGKKKHKLISDAFFKQDQTYFFIEVDYKQKMTVNCSKIELYSKLFPLLEVEHRVDCVLIFYTLTEARRQRLMKECEKKKVTCGVFTKEDME
ncbi:replication-relaxation family protein [Priestia flexa]|uniref:replication-relaxation family protein n=1 Tax=Priestia flexa TaxID=86664 RepID=UPI003D27AA7A